VIIILACLTVEFDEKNAVSLKTVYHESIEAIHVRFIDNIVVDLHSFWTHVIYQKHEMATII